MNMPTLSQMEDRISRLSLDEQIWLMERLVQRIKENTVDRKSHLENDLIAMANDPEVQSELREIEKAFDFTEMDGLEIP